MDQREIKREQLRRLQELQLKAFDAGLNMQIGTRNTGTDKAWITGYVYPEGTDFVKCTNGVDYLDFPIYEARDFWSAERNFDVWEEEFDKIDKFIKRWKKD